MYIIIGNSPRKVELKDLGDVIYYKQQKVYTDSQYESSNDLKEAIKRRDLLVLKKVEENKDHTTGTPIGFSSSTSDLVSTKIDTLIEKLQNLEKIIDQKSPQESNLLMDILGRIERLEKSLTKVDIDSLKNIVKEEILKEGTMESKKIFEEILTKIDSLTVQKSVEGFEKEENVSTEEVYVPNIVVEDARSNIKLEVRAVENKDNISDSLKKLKELKSKSK